MATDTPFSDAVDYGDPMPVTAGAWGTSKLLLAVGAVLMGTAASAVAQSACVVCAGPPAVYSCFAEDPSGSVVVPGDRAAGFVCITELARRNGHGSCMVRRDAGTGCDGQRQRVSLSPAPDVQPTISQPSRPAVAKTPDPAAAPPGAPPSPATADVPKTMVEVARRTATASDRELDKASSAVTTSVRSAGDALSKTGKAVGNAVSATFDCVTSLFKRCGG